MYSTINIDAFLDRELGQCLKFSALRTSVERKIAEMTTRVSAEHSHYIKKDICIKQRKLFAPSFVIHADVKRSLIQKWEADIDMLEMFGSLWYNEEVNRPTVHLDFSQHYPFGLTYCGTKYHTLPTLKKYHEDMKGKITGTLHYYNDSPYPYESSEDFTSRTGIETKLVKESSYTIIDQSEGSDILHRCSYFNDEYILEDLTRILEEYKINSFEDQECIELLLRQHCYTIHEQRSWDEYANDVIFWEHWRS
jgi:hypothetical protein